MYVHLVCVCVCVCVLDFSLIQSSYRSQSKHVLSGSRVRLCGCDQRPENFREESGGNIRNQLNLLIYCCVLSFNLCCLVLFYSNFSVYYIFCHLNLLLWSFPLLISLVSFLFYIYHPVFSITWSELAFFSRITQHVQVELCTYSMYICIFPSFDIFTLTESSSVLKELKPLR